MTRNDPRPRRQGERQLNVGCRPSLRGRDADRRASRRMLLAAAMLRRGDDQDRISKITGVPAAMIDLIRVRRRA